MAKKNGPERRNQIIEMAQQLFYTKGYESTSVNDIINAVGVSKGGFYHHFSSKQAVLMAVIDGLARQAVVIIEPVLNDAGLNAIEKLVKIMNTANDWKIGQRDQMLAMAKVMYSDENLLLQHKLTAEMGRIQVPVLAQIIEEGVADGIFDLGLASSVDAAECVLTIMHQASETFLGYLLDEQRSADAAEIVIKKYAATQTFMERILGAPAGSLQMVNSQTINQWFVPNLEQAVMPDMEG